MNGRSSPLERIVSRFGGQNALARALSLRQSTVWGWVKTGRIPYDRIPGVVEAARRLDPPLELSAADFVAIPSAKMETQAQTGEAA